MIFELIFILVIWFLMWSLFFFTLESFNDTCFSHQPLFKIFILFGMLAIIGMIIGIPLLVALMLIGGL